MFVRFLFHKFEPGLLAMDMWYMICDVKWSNMVCDDA